MSADESNADLSMNMEGSKDSASESMGEQNQESADASKSAASIVAAETFSAAATEVAAPEDKGSEEEKVSKSDDMISDAVMESKEAEESKKATETKELPYSTRGRSNNDADHDSRVARDALDEIGRKESTSTATLGTSFLESLSEEERRSRTRYLPEVDGMHSLRKLEIKEDLHLARSLLSSTSSVTGKKKKRGSRNEDSTMDTDGDGGVSSSEDVMSETPRSGHTIEMRSRDLIVPNHTFIAPPGVKADDDGQNSPVLGKKDEVQSPFEVESITAFNPPRPPESIGAKKKHRMLRWERRPEDIETDLNNYRKTVQRTRQELQNAETEYGRLQTIDAHLRWHFLNHLNLLNGECMRLNGEMGSVRQECVKAADLFASRTRSRGAGKGSYVMRDVLTALKQRGMENSEPMETETTSKDSVQTFLPTIVPGIGGVPFSSLKDFGHDTKMWTSKPASAWIVAGDKVKTPYGEGEVITVRPAAVERSGANKPVKEGETPHEDASTKQDDELEEYKPAAILPPTVSVQLPFGTGHFAISQIKPMGCPSSFTDKQLAKRWENMMETALAVGGALDVGAMCSVDVVPPEEDNDEELGINSDAPSSNSNVEGALVDEDARFLPFGSGLLPSEYGRGAFLATMPLEQIEKEIHHALHNGEGVLGRPTNPGVPDNIKEWEKEQQELLTLRAESLHLRNNLIRQRQIRMMNERTKNSAVERYERAESLVMEMKADLKSLIGRLDADLGELGINEEMAAKILAKFFRGEDEEAGEPSPFKRQRRMTMTRPEEDFEEDMIAYPEGATSDREMFEDVSGDESESHRATEKICPNQ